MQCHYLYYTPNIQIIIYGYFVPIAVIGFKPELFYNEPCRKSWREKKVFMHQWSNFRCQIKITSQICENSILLISEIVMLFFQHVCNTGTVKLGSVTINVLCYFSDWNHQIHYKKQHRLVRKRASATLCPGITNESNLWMFRWDTTAPFWSYTSNHRIIFNFLSHLLFLFQFLSMKLVLFPKI